MHIPTAPEDIDPRWLTEALSPRHPGVQVAAVEVTDRREVTNVHAKLRVRYDEAAGAPERIFAKLAPLDPSRRGSIVASGMGEREARFYATVAPRLSLRVPEAHVAAHDADGTFVLLLEDIDAGGCRVSDGTWGITPDGAARALEDLSTLHLRYLDRSLRQAEVPWAAPVLRASAYGVQRLQYGLEHHRDRLSAQFAEIAELYVEHADRLNLLWHSCLPGPTTVLHGDAHIGNVFDDAGRVGFLDWGVMKESPALRDVSYFLQMAPGPRQSSRLMS